jgi:DNA-binding transcriptional MerR regulator
MQQFPFLDIQDALRDADRNLADIARYVEALQHDTEGHLPRDAAQLLANVAACRELLGWILPPQTQEAIAKEQEELEAMEAQYSA